MADRMDIEQQEDSALDVLAALREERVADTTMDVPVPGTRDLLWAGVQIVGGSTRVLAVIAGGASEATSVACEFIARAVTGLWLAEGATEDGQPRNARPLAATEYPPTFIDPLEQIVPKLCPPRPIGEHTPATRVRALIASDPLVERFAMQIAGWMQGANQAVSERFVGESQAGPR